MHAFASSWSDAELVQRVARLPRGQNIAVLERLDDPAKTVAPPHRRSKKARQRELAVFGDPQEGSG